MAVEHKRHTIARMAVGRGIRLRSSLPPSEPTTLPHQHDVLCAGCGRVVCEGPRTKLFAGMVLRCNGCGASVRVHTRS